MNPRPPSARPGYAVAALTTGAGGLFRHVRSGVLGDTAMMPVDSSVLTKLLLEVQRAEVEA